MACTFRFLLFWKLLIVTTVSCDNLIVKTDSGQVRGVPLRTWLDNKEYIAYRGIPYAEPPIGNLRFKVPVPIAAWPGILDANDYGNSCLALYPQMFPLNNTKSEDCLFLNVFTPVTHSNKVNSKKAVMFFIHGGSFAEGDGANGFYGADFIVDNDVVLVTINYRLGPWGFASFDLNGYTGNMGFKDQQMALEWIHRNIKYFGGDPNLITVFGESAGAVSAHFHTLADKSRNLIKRSIAMSGTAFALVANYAPNNHIELFKKIFGLGAEATGQDVLDYMLTATNELILEKTPVMSLERSVATLYFSAVVEDPEKAENAFLTERPRDIYRTTNVDVDTMFGVTSTEAILIVDPTNPYYWIEEVGNYSIGLPFSGLTLSPESCEYREAAKKVYKFYFGDRKLEATLENLNKYLQMFSDMNFVYPTYEGLQLHSVQAKTNCYKNNLDLSLNFIKITRSLGHLRGMSHFEDLLYLFKSDEYVQLYDNVKANPADPKNRKTLAALEFVPKMFTEYAKRGTPSYFGKYQGSCHSCIEITNAGLKPIFGLNKRSMEFWDEIRKSVEPWIVNPF